MLLFSIIISLLQPIKSTSLVQLRLARITRSDCATKTFLSKTTTQSCFLRMHHVTLMRLYKYLLIFEQDEMLGSTTSPPTFEGDLR